jgi:hypothetical protein
MKAARLRIAPYVLAALLNVPSTAATQVLNFEGIATPANPSKPIGNYYNGGSGPNFGIEFSSNASALCLNTLLIHCSNASRGGFGDPGSQAGGLSSDFGNFMMFNVASGFSDGFSFFYTSIFSGGVVFLYSGPNGTGTLLAVTHFSPNQFFTGGCPAGYGAAYCPFSPVGLSFTGVAHSVRFEVLPNEVAIDDVTFGYHIPGLYNPLVAREPSSLALFATGLAALGIVLGRQRRRLRATRWLQQ